MLNKIKITMVSLDQPCTACLIIEGHLKEMLAKLEIRMDNIEVENIIIHDLKNIHSIEGLEIEKFPALLINNEQITAGSLPPLDVFLNQLKLY